MIELVGAAACLYVASKLYDKDRKAIKRKWKMTMGGCGAKNKYEQTYEVLEVITKKYGFDMLISLPKGLSYEELEKLLPKIETGLSCVAEMKWKRFKTCAFLKVASQDYDEKVKFVPFKTEGSWNLYFGDTFFLEHIVANMQEMPHVLVAGATASGKSRCVFIALTNLLYWHDETEVELYLLQVSDKKDLQKYAYYKQTKYFAKNLQTTDQLLKYMLEEMKIRNKKLGTLNNIYEYNKLHPKDTFKTCYVVIDEGARLMPGEKNVDPDYEIKKRIMANLTHLLQEGRSSGIYVIESLQRPDKVTVDPNAKANFNIKIGFRANNTASSKVMADDDSLHNLPNREALFMGSEYKTLKTPYIDDKLIKELLQSRYEENHKYIEIFPKKHEETPGEPQKETRSNVTPISKKSKGVIRK
jgi:S-DNA-T family DNA segregation ATPase FtsK/SpoIIIE